MDTMTLEIANKLIAKALSQAAADYRRPICVSVCDASGNLVAFARNDGAPLRSIQISQGKAYSSARLLMNTDAFLDLLHREHFTARDFCDDKITSLPGGAVLKNPSGELIGGIGVSGLKPQEDQVIVSMLAGLVASGSF